MIFCALALAASETLIAAGARWSYVDTGSVASTWAQLTYDDSAWSSGNAELGYGDGGEATTVSYGASSTSKYPTTWFRNEFSVADPTAYDSLDLSLVLDDGAVVYLNGAELTRMNLPTGTVTSSTLATTAIGGTDESAWTMTSHAATGLVAGTNVLAVEVHQAAVTSSDISLNVSLVGQSGQAVTRGPYLQSGDSDSIVIRWRTNTPTDSVVTYGTSTLSSTSWSSAQTTDHAVTLTGLSAATAYYYTVGSSTGLTVGDISYRFETAPTPGSEVPVVVWVLGDSGTADAEAEAVRDAWGTWAGGASPDLWLMLGDNAYNSGTDDEYQAAVFDMYSETLRSSVLWPTMGNHDGDSADSATQSGVYYDIFTLPTDSSGTEAYYSFDYANVHFIGLDSEDSDRDVGSPMLAWLESDLAMNTQPWTVVFFHHPPYSKGSHDSDVDVELTEMRENVVPILEAYGVDLVLSGHSHSYERSYLIDDFLGPSTTMTAANLLDSGSGDPLLGEGYVKATYGAASHEGEIFVVAGNGGKASVHSLDHPAMYTGLAVTGSVALQFEGPTLIATFIDSTGAEQDVWSIEKGGTCAVPAVLPDCGNGVCEAGDGEDCVSCPGDCRGKQSGKRSGQFCCGDGDGTNPKSCSSTTCNTLGYTCTTTAVLTSTCCGDGYCAEEETASACADDCPGCSSAASTCTLSTDCCTGICRRGVCK